MICCLRDPHTQPELPEARKNSTSQRQARRQGSLCRPGNLNSTPRSCTMAKERASAIKVPSEHHKGTVARAHIFTGRRKRGTNSQPASAAPKQVTPGHRAFHPASLSLDGI